MADDVIVIRFFSSTFPFLICQKGVIKTSSLGPPRRSNTRRAAFSTPTANHSSEWSKTSSPSHRLLCMADDVIVIYQVFVCLGQILFPDVAKKGVIKLLQDPPGAATPGERYFSTPTINRSFTISSLRQAVDYCTSVYIIYIQVDDITVIYLF